jgi:hypothetical protein
MFRRSGRPPELDYLPQTQDDQGRPVLPGFTDESHLSVWLPGGAPYAKAAPAGFLPSGWWIAARFSPVLSLVWY